MLLVGSVASKSYPKEEMDEGEREAVRQLMESLDEQDPPEEDFINALVWGSVLTRICFGVSSGYGADLMRDAI